VGRCRLRHDPAQAHPADRDARRALVHQLHRAGLAIRAIARQTGHTKNTVKRWLKLDPPPAASAPLPAVTVPPPEAASAEPSRESAVVPAPTPGRVPPDTAVAPGATPVPVGPTPTTIAPPPAPWTSWDEVRAYRQQLRDVRYRLGARTDSLTPAERATRDAVLARPASAALRTAHDFMQTWYAIWWDEADVRRSPDDARARYVGLREEPAAQMLPAPQRIQRNMTDARVTALSHFLREPTFEATSNGAERAGRLVRHLQAPHFGWRTTAALEGSLAAHARHRMEAATAATTPEVGRSKRGRRPTTSRVAAVAVGA
jgi:hypothetical protein